MEKKRVYIGADHAGFSLKEFLKKHLESKGHEVYDEGAFILSKRDDYPDFAAKVAKAVADNPQSIGILCCGSAQGMAIAANKISGIRAVAITNIKEATITRTHNNANVLCLAGWYLTRAKASKLADTFIATQFSDHPRHVRRLKKIARLEH